MWGNSPIDGILPMKPDRDEDLRFTEALKQVKTLREYSHSSQATNRNTDSVQFPRIPGAAAPFSVCPDAMNYLESVSR